MSTTFSVDLVVILDKQLTEFNNLNTIYSKQNLNVCKCQSTPGGSMFLNNEVLIFGLNKLRGIFQHI